MHETTGPTFQLISKPAYVPEPPQFDLLRAIREAAHQVRNSLIPRSALSRGVGGGSETRRNVYQECDYPDDGATITPRQYQNLYDREAIAARVVEVMPRETWRVTPTVYEDESTENVTAFEEAWDGLGRMLQGEDSYYQDEAGSPVWEYLKRVDELSGIGQFGVLLFGFNDGRPLNSPAYGVDVRDVPGKGVIREGVFSPETVVQDGPVRASVPEGTDAQYYQGLYQAGLPGPSPPDVAPADRKILFLRVFPESLVEVTQWESNVYSPRFGHPIMYRITFNDPMVQISGVGMPLNSLDVHWTRVIHVADTWHTPTSSEVLAVPRMRPVYNNLLGLRKLYCGSPEMYWLAAFLGVSFETDPSLGGEARVLDSETMKGDIEKWMAGLQRYLLLNGVTAKPLGPQVVDPTPQINTLIAAVCVKLEIPVPVFQGYEIGEQASTENRVQWQERVNARRTGYVTPRVIVPFVDRLIWLEVLPTPSGYSVAWPDHTSISQDAKASIALKLSQAISYFLQAGGDALMQPMDFLTRILGLEEEDAQAVMDATEAHLEDVAQQQADAEEAQRQHELEMAKVAPPPAPPTNQPPNGRQQQPPTNGPPQPPKQPPQPAGKTGE
jgi:hypothetical protein